jgi:S-adenosylmethionine:tRNA ribosyltransferase-isomerase
LQLSDFDFHLPPGRIAQQPLADRAAARMLVIDRHAGSFRDAHFRDLPSYLTAGDCLVLNDSRVFPSRLYGVRQGGTGRVEIFLTKPLDADRRHWLALGRPGRKLLAGTEIVFSPRLRGRIEEHRDHGERIISLECDGPLDEALDEAGHVPLPPYIKRPDDAADRERYQTVFARHRGSVAAPTAGLHFTPEVLHACATAGAQRAYVTLHVGLGTFESLHAPVITENRLHSEYFSISPESAALIGAARRVIAVGTTSVRTLETAHQRGGIAAMTGDTDIFLYPGSAFGLTGAMVTNFHLPQSSLFLLVCAFAGRELMLAAYQHAIQAEYRFFSYGDCCLIL